MTDRLRRRLAAGLFLSGLLLVGVAQFLLVRPPERLAHGPDWLKALEPIWPQPGAVVLAVGLFVLGSACWAVGTRRLLDEAPIDSITLAFRRARGSLAALGSVAIGAALYGYLLLQLYRHPKGPSHAGGFLLSWGLILGGLFWSERETILGSRRGTEESRPAVWEILYVTALTALFFFLATFDLQNWYFSCLGDEFAFREASKLVAEGHPWAGMFSQEGVYGIVPAASAWFQGMLMRFFGTGLRGWKTAAIVPVLGSLPPAYGLARTLFGRRVALFTLAMLASAAYLLGYAHTGYPNLEPLLPTLASLFLFVVGLRGGSRAFLVLSGVFAGLGWYTFYSSRATIVILAAAIVLGVRPRQWPAIGGLVAGGFLLLFLPMLVVNRGELVGRMLEQSLRSKEVAANRAMLPIWNCGRSLLAFNYNTHSGPYMAGSLAEPVTAALFVLGLSYCATAWRDARSRCLLGWFAIAVIVTGVLSKYDYVSVSRLHYVLPVVALLAALGLDRTLRVVQAFVPAAGKWWPRVATAAAAIALITASNLHRWFVESPLRAASSTEALTIRILELPRCQRAARPPLIVDVGVGGGILPALDARKSPARPEFGLYSDEPRWLETADLRCVVFRSPADPEAKDLMEAIEEVFPRKEAAEEHDRSGQTKIRVYYPSGK